VSEVLPHVTELHRGTMRVVCAWCGKVLGEKPGPAADVSHGICEDCLDLELQDIR
jgi:ribosomal protein S27E